MSRARDIEKWHDEEACRSKNATNARAALGTWHILILGQPSRGPL